MGCEGVDMRKPRGFTLLELMVVLIVAAIILTLAVPNFRTLMMNSRLSNAVSNLSGALNYARNTALSQNAPIGMCPVSPPAAAGQAPGTTCQSSFGSSTTGSAWMVFSGSSGTPTPLATYTVPASDQIAITSTASATITFSGHGLANTNGVLTVCDPRGAGSAQAVAVNAAGYVQISTAPGAAPDGSALTCH